MHSEIIANNETTLLKDAIDSTQTSAMRILQLAHAESGMADCASRVATHDAPTLRGNTDNDRLSWRLKQTHHICTNAQQFTRIISGNIGMHALWAKGFGLDALGPRLGPRVAVRIRLRYRSSTEFRFPRLVLTMYGHPSCLRHGHWSESKISPIVRPW